MANTSLAIESRIPSAMVPASGPGTGEVRLDALLDGRRLWRAASPAIVGARTGLSTGSSILDAALPGGGWPRAALTELLVERHGAGELALVAPALAALTTAGRWIAWVAPPHTPYAPALAEAGIDLSRQLLVNPPDTECVRDALWAAEQALRSGSCGAVLVWADPEQDAWIRRLSLAAAAGDSICLLFRPAEAATRASAAALRIKVAPRRLLILKCRGGRPQRVSWPDPAPAGS